MSTKKICLFGKFIFGRFVFQASAEPVLQDSRRICGCKTYSRFQKSEYLKNHVFRASLETRVFIGSTSQTTHTIQNHFNKNPPNQTNQNTNQSHKPQTKQPTPPETTQQNTTKPNHLKTFQVPSSIPSRLKLKNHYLRLKNNKNYSNAL